MTYLRSIRLRGFKTFARSTEMLFEPGVTVVIGPNGSGKSNITDAVDSRKRKVKSREESVRERQKKGEAELKDVRLQRETEENRFAEVLADRDVATADYHRAKGDLDRLTARAEAVERRLAGLRTEVERAERQRTSVEAALADVEDRLMVLRDMPDHTSGRLEAVENVATAVTEEARALRPEMETDERKAEELRDLILEQESARSRIQQSLELLEQEKQDLGRRGDK